VPSDAPNPNEDRKGFSRKSLRMTQILSWSKQIEAKHALFLFDSCFSGSVLKERALVVPQQIRRVTSKPVRQFISAGSAGQTVPADSIFRPSFIRGIRGEADLDKDGYVTGTELGLFLQKRVASYDTGQTPQFGKIKDPLYDEGDFVFALPHVATEPEPSSTAAAPASATPSTSAPSEFRADEEAWKTLMDSDDPEDFRFFLEVFPASPLAKTAKFKLRQLDRKQAKAEQERIAKQEEEHKRVEAEQRRIAEAKRKAEAERKRQEELAALRNKADSRVPIVIPRHNWSSQIVMAYVIGGIFESLGDNVEYVPAGSQAVYESIRLGEVTISHEVWEYSHGGSFYNAIAKGGVIDAGTHAAVTREEVGVPQWVIDKNLCPGLPNWEALKNCKDVFTTPDSGGKGRILDGPQSWHGSEYPDRVQALLGDDWVVQFAGSAHALWEELASAKKEGRGTIIFNWTPNFTDREGFVFIEWPPHYPRCRKQDGGDNKCGSPKGWLKKAANNKFPKTHPAAYRAFSQMSFNITDIGQMTALVDIDRMSHKDAAKKWLADHEDVWKPFTQ